MPSGSPVIAHAIESHPTDSGYWVLWSDGTVTAHGALIHHGNANRVGFTRTEYVGALRRTLSGGGYWIVSGSGIVQAFGDAVVLGDAEPATTLLDIIWDFAPNYGGGTGYGLLRATGEFEVFGDFEDQGSPATGDLGNVHPWAILDADTYDQVNDSRWYVPATEGMSDLLKKSASPSGNNAAANGFGAPDVTTMRARTT